MTIVFTTSLPQEGFSRLGNHQLIIPQTPYFSNDELTRILSEGADVLVATFDYKVSAEMLEAAKGLRLVANFGVGFNNIDTAWCKTHGVVVTNTPLPVIEPTAEHCFALLHAVAHRTAELDRRLRLPDYDGIRFGVMNNLGTSLYGKTLGIIGMGRIGRAVARRAVGCGMKIAYHNRHRLPAETEALYGATYLPMEQLLKESDFVSLNLPYTPEVHHLIGKRELQMMKPTVMLINTARGAHIDEEALAEALRDGVIAGAALDVYENEPAIHPLLLKQDNVVLSPHIGTGTIEGRLEMCHNVEDNILYFEQGERQQMNIVID